jgi:hypothetical protein
LRVALTIVEKEADVTRTEDFDQAFVLRAVLVNRTELVATEPEPAPGVCLSAAIAASDPMLVID